MSTPTAPRRGFLVRTATEPGPSPCLPLRHRLKRPQRPQRTTSHWSSGVWRQVRNGLDRERLLPADDKRRRDLASAWTTLGNYSIRTDDRRALNHG